MSFFLHFVLHVSTAAIALSVRDSLVSCILYVVLAVYFIWLYTEPTDQIILFIGQNVIVDFMATAVRSPMCIVRRFSIPLRRLNNSITSLIIRAPAGSDACTRLLPLPLVPGARYCFHRRLSVRLFVGRITQNGRRCFTLASVNAHWVELSWVELVVYLEI